MSPCPSPGPYAAVTTTTPRRGADISALPVTPPLSTTLALGRLGPANAPRALLPARYDEHAVWNADAAAAQSEMETFYRLTG